MPWRGVAPIQLVIGIIGAVLMLGALTMSTLAIVAVWRGHDVTASIPQELTTVTISALTALAGLLTPNTGLTTSARTARHAAVAGQAAAAAVVEHEQLHDLAVEANNLLGDK